MAHEQELRRAAPGGRPDPEPPSRARLDPSTDEAACGPSPRAPGYRRTAFLGRALIAGLVAFGAHAAIAPSAGLAEARLLLGLDRPAGIEAALDSVADPSSAEYRDHIAPQELRRRFGAKPATVARVRRYLAAKGVASTVDPTRTFVAASMSVEQAAAVFGPGIVRLVETEGLVAQAKDALPRGLRGAVREVAGLDQFDATTAESGLVTGRRGRAAETRPLGTVDLPSRTGRATGCREGRGVGPGGELGRRFPGTKAFTPNQMQSAFGLAPLHRAGIEGRGQSVALIEFGGGFRAQDLAAFARCFGLPEPIVRAHTVGIQSPIVPLEGSATLETTLDIQTVMAAAPRARIEVMEAGPETPWAEALASALDARRLGRLPSVASISYGVCEPLAGPSGSGPADRRLFERVANAAGLVGVSVVVSTGDSGSSSCAHLLGSLPLADVPLTVVAGTASVSWPASSRSVTAVGGTTMRLDGANAIVSHRPWNDTRDGIPSVLTAGEPGAEVVSFPAGAGTGGASRFYRQPGYQARAGLMSGRRQVPDVSMYAAAYPGVAVRCSVFDPVAKVGPCPPDPVFGSWSAVGGTSFAAPLLAGGIALANERAARAGAPSLGFANPLLYDRGTRRAAIRDVTEGTNAIFSVGCCQAGPGYDQATGWGTVDVARLSLAAQRSWRARP